MAEPNNIVQMQIRFESAIEWNAIDSIRFILFN